jgi:cell division protein FtsW
MIPGAAVKALQRDGVRGPDGRRRLPGLPSSRRLLLAVVLILLGVSAVMVLSASSVKAYASTDSSYSIFRKQIVWLALGLAVLALTSRVDYHRWRRFAPLLVLLALVGLVVVLFIGKEVDGGRRWIVLPGGQHLQPSELAKLGILLFGADALTRKERLFADVRHQVVPVLPLTVVLAGLIMLEPDLGTTILVAAIAFGLLFLAGTPLRVLTFFGGAGLLAGFALIMSAAYRRDRFFSFLNPEADPLDSGMHILQSLRAFGEGGVFGVGLGQGFAKWGNVPNAHTDFIFAVIGEELGLVGTLGVVSLFGLFAYAGVRAARNAPDAFGRYLAGGVTIWVTVTAIVNMGAVVGVLPITGVPLPLVSFGGSSMLVLMAAIGMTLNVAKVERVRTTTPLLVTTAPAAHATRRGPTRAGARQASRQGQATARGPVQRASRAPAGDADAAARGRARTGEPRQRKATTP